MTTGTAWAKHRQSAIDTSCKFADWQSRSTVIDLSVAATSNAAGGSDSVDTAREGRERAAIRLTVVHSSSERYQ